MGKDLLLNKTSELSHEILSSILQGMMEGVVFLDPHYKVCLMNSAAEKMLDQPSANLFNQVIVQALGNKHPLSILIKRIHAPQERFLKSELKLNHVDGSEYTLEVLLKILQDPDRKPLGILILIYDVTQNRMQEQARAHFIASTSHELRTPLAAIKAALSLLFDKTLGAINEKQMNILQIADHNINRLTAFVQKFLDMTKFEVSTRHITKKEQSINKVVEESVALFIDEAKSRGLVLLFKPATSIPTLSFDRDHIFQVMCNLLSNALKFTTRGKIMVTTKLDSKDPRWVNVSIEDTGRGMKETELRTLFMKDQPLDEFLTQKKDSFGIGLAVCKEIVSEHGGKIWAKSQEGEGSIFIFSLPSEEIEERKKVMFYGYKILIVDDEEGILETLKILLQANGYDVYSASNGEAALKLLDQEFPDLMLLDLKMPEMDGFQVCEKVREQVRFKNLPILALTAFDDEAYIQKAFFKGANGFIVKPFETLQILSTIKSILKDHSFLKKAA